MNSEHLLQNNNFSHIYVEKEAFSYETTEKILKTFPNARVIAIDHYRMFSIAAVRITGCSMKVRN